MKKIIACISLVFAMSLGATAMASELPYSSADNSVTADGSEYTTVLITSESDDIVYLDQDDSGLSATAKFLIKADAVEGTYTVLLGGNSDGSTASHTFIIANEPDPVPEVTTTTVLGKEYNEENTTYSIGCKAESVAVSACNYVVITATKGDITKTAYIDSGFTGSGDGEINVAVKITGVPSDVDVTVGLSDISE
jgi:hypothetical protein